MAGVRSPHPALGMLGQVAWAPGAGVRPHLSQSHLPVFLRRARSGGPGKTVSEYLFLLPAPARRGPGSCDSGGRTRTSDLQLMRLASCRCSTAAMSPVRRHLGGRCGRPSAGLRSCRFTSPADQPNAYSKSRATRAGRQYQALTAQGMGHLLRNDNRSVSFVHQNPLGSPPSKSSAPSPGSGFVSLPTSPLFGGAVSSVSQE